MIKISSPKIIQYKKFLIAKRKEKKMNAVKCKKNEECNFEEIKNIYMYVNLNIYIFFIFFF